MKKSVIIVAGGSGSRMGTTLPKQFLPIANKPMLLHSLLAFHQYDPDIHIVVVLPEAWTDYWYKLCQENNIKLIHQTVTGGDTRFQSVKNGLLILPAEGLIAVHDAARPYISVDLISRCFNEAEIHGNAIPVMPVAESLRLITGNGNHPVNRQDYVTIQTPQVFDAALLHRAYQKDYDAAFTDDATVVEKLGVPIHLIAGEFRNVKITWRADLSIQ